MTKNGMKRFLNGIGYSSYSNLVLSDVRCINLRSNGNHCIDRSDELTFDMTNELIKIKEYDRVLNSDGTITKVAKTDNKFDVYIAFSAVVGFSL